MWPGYGRSVDWWSLGVLVHELVTGVTPWRHHDIYTLYDMIIDQEFTWHTGELTARPLSAECCRHLHNSVTNLISLAAVISDSRRDRWWEWGGGWRDTRDTGDQGFRHQAPGPGCRQGGRERWVFDLLSHQKLFRDLGVAQLGPARLRIIPGSSVSIGTRWAVTWHNYHHHDTHCQVDSGCLRPPIIPDLRCPGDSDQYPEYGEDMWWHDHQDNRETSQYNVLQVGCAWASPGWQRQVHWILRRRGKCEDCDSNNCEDQILKTFLNSLH